MAKTEETKQKSETTKLIRPVEEKHIVTSPYGWRTLYGKRQMHDGIDYVSLRNRNVLAVADGRVLKDVDYYDASRRWTDRRHSAGNYVILEHRIHGQKYFCRYLHLAQNFVEQGQQVKQGHVLGIYGDVGYSFGAHLHFDIYDERWVKLDPTPILIRGLKANGLA